MRARSLLVPTALLAALLTGVACSGGGSSGGGQVNVKLLVAASPDPFQGLSRLRVEVRQNQLLVTSASFAPGSSFSIPGLTEGSARTVTLVGLGPSGAVVSHGRTIPFSFVNNQTVTQTLYFARSDTFSTTQGTSSATGREGASAAVLPDGKILVAGGLDAGNAAVATADLYDPATDTLTPTASMTTGHAFATSMVVTYDVIAVAGGIQTLTANGATAIADYFDYTTGTWTRSSMSSPRRDACGSALGTGYALIAGGADAQGNALDTVELCTWSASQARCNWQALPGTLANKRQGCVALPEDTLDVIVGAGFDPNAGGGGTPYNDAEELSFSAAPPSGYVIHTGRGNFADAMGFPGIAPIPGGWLLFGGQASNGGGGALIRNTETVQVSVGNPINANGGPQLPGSQRRGGGALLVDGRTILVGGDRSTNQGSITPVDQGQIFQGGTFTAAGSPGPTAGAVLYPLPDGTAISVSAQGVRRYNPPYP